MNALFQNRRDFIGAAAMGTGLAALVCSAPAAHASEATTLAYVDAVMQIDNIIAQYSLSMDYCDPELGYDCAWPDATFDYGGDFVFDTQGFIEWAMESNITNFVGSRHDMVETWHKIVGDKAVTETRAIVNLTRRSEDGEFLNTLLNTYLDYWERRDGVWKIAKRYLQCDAGWNMYEDHIVVTNNGSGRMRADNFVNSHLKEFLALLDE